MRIEGTIVDPRSREIFEGSIEIEAGIIKSIDRHPTEHKGYIMAGFINSHVHTESSMLTPTNLAKMLISRGTVAIVSDPHEIANVMGVDGVEWALRNATSASIKCYFTIPSCVPATPFDRAGGVITAAQTEQLAASGRFVALSEMMNVPGVLFRDEEVMGKLRAAKQANIPTDGHAPMVAGEDLTTYINSGISTDHECMTLEEAEEKVTKGMKILIREGSAARNYPALHPLISSHPESVMFCTDDSHPDDIIERGDIDKIVRRAIADGHDLFDTLRIASINPIEHYKLNVGSLRVGDPADFIIVKDLTQFETQKVYIDGELRYDISNIEVVTNTPTIEIINNFHHDLISTNDLRKAVSGEITVMGLIKNELITTAESYTPKCATDNLESDTEQDIIKIVYINRYTNGAPIVAYCKGFGLKQGAVASSIGHDSHNIVAVGVNDIDLKGAINALIENRGGLAICQDGKAESLALPIAGIISDLSGAVVAERYGALQRKIREMGSPLPAPFMTLSFLSLVVIPEIKIGEQGLFSYSQWGWI